MWECCPILGPGPGDRVVRADELNIGVLRQSGRSRVVRSSHAQHSAPTCQDEFVIAAYDLRRRRNLTSLSGGSLSLD